MHQGQLTQNEKLAIQELLMAEELCSKKVQNYMNQVQDPAVQKVLQQMSEKTSNHVSTLSRMMQQEASSTAGYTAMQQ